MDHSTSAAPAPYYVLRVSRTLGTRVRAHVVAIKAVGGIESITHFVTKAIEGALAKSSGGRS